MKVRAETFCRRGLPRQTKQTRIIPQKNETCTARVFTHGGSFNFRGRGVTTTAHLFNCGPNGRGLPLVKPHDQPPCPQFHFPDLNARGVPVMRDGCCAAVYVRDERIAAPSPSCAHLLHFPGAVAGGNRVVTTRRRADPENLSVGTSSTSSPIFPRFAHMSGEQPARTAPRFTRVSPTPSPRRGPSGSLFPAAVHAHIFADSGPGFLISDLTVSGGIPFPPVAAVIDRRTLSRLSRRNIRARSFVFFPTRADGDLAGWRSQVARVAHNHEAVGSNPSPAPSFP